jgi:hypothetical protein
VKSSNNTKKNLIVSQLKLLRAYSQRYACIIDENERLYLVPDTRLHS